MRKSILTFLLLCFSIFFIIHVPTAVYAQDNVYELIDIHVKLDEEGNGHVTEHWIAHLYKDTENFIIKEDLGKAKVENFTVTENGQQYDFQKKWNIDASREEKSFKNGIVKTKKGVELAWGIGEYGTHEYILEYTVTNMIKQLKDAQVLHWVFTNPGINGTRQRINVHIEAPKYLNEDDEKIWAFGYHGDIEFYDGKIVVQNDQPLTTDHHVTLLVQFDKDLFATKNKENKKFAKLQKEAFKGSDYSLNSTWETIMFFLKPALTFLGIALLIGVLAYLSNRSNTASAVTRVGKPRKFSRQYNEEYYRDYPHKGFYMETYYITYLMGLSSFNTIFTVLLLRWLQEDKISMTEITSGMFNRRSQEIRFLVDEMEKDTYEGRIFNSMRKLAKEGNVVTDKQLSKWAYRNYNGLRGWEESVMDESINLLKSDNHLIETTKNYFLFKTHHYKLTESGKEMEKNIYKFVNYLHDFSLLAEHDAINVKIWDDLMIWAAYLNLTDVVMEQFKKVYPKYVEETKLKEDVVRRSSYMAEEVERNRRRRERAERRKEQRRRSSGGGGRASLGGGGGASGGGHGGGTR